MVSFNLFAEPATVQARTEVTALRVYPIKSCRGIEIRSASLTRSGLELDRQWMLVDVDKGNEFITIRQLSRMTLIDTAFAGADGSEYGSGEADAGSEGLQIVASLRGAPEKRVAISARPTPAWLQENCSRETVVIWEEPTEGWLYPDSVNAFFREATGKNVALVLKGCQERLAGANGGPAVLGRKAALNFPDIMPLLVANEASINELNERLRQKEATEITWERFRPNVVVRGGEQAGMPAWSEDTWKTIRFIDAEGDEATPLAPPSAPSAVSSALSSALSSWTRSAPASTAPLDLDVCMRCARCLVPNVDPDTAEKDKHEPWDTLMSYRRVDEGIKYKPCFGMLCAPRNEGVLRVGMQLHLLDTTLEHRWRSE